jgi:hypothetical protein
LSASLSAVLASGVAHAASTTNFTDQWSVASEPGWGASVQQQSDTLLVNLMVYGADSKPTWFIGAASLQTNPPQGHTVFSGDLYAATGPYYGWGWGASPVTPRKVGTMTFDATSASNATMSYTVDGTLVVKNVTRLTWAYENLSGSYYGGWGADRSGCEDPPNNTHFEDALTITVAQDADNAVTVTLRFGDGGEESFSGTYAQSGRLGRIADGEFSVGFGAISVSEIEIARSGFTARFTGDLITARWRDWCDMKNGYIAAVRR